MFNGVLYGGKGGKFRCHVEFGEGSNDGDDLR